MSLKHQGVLFMSQFFVWIIDEDLVNIAKIKANFELEKIDYIHLSSPDTVDPEKHICTFVLCHIDSFIKYEFQLNDIGKAFTSQCTSLIVYGDHTRVEDLKSALLRQADDFFILPQALDLITSKLQASARKFYKLRSQIAHHAQVITLDNMRIDPMMKQVTLHERQLPFTLTEFNIIYTLASNPFKTHSMDYLFELITGQSSFGDYNAIMTHISRMRKKIAQVDPKGKYIITVRNQGYRFNEKLLES